MAAGFDMRINHNIQAMFAQRQLVNSNINLSKNLERLSSGFRINSAADDSAGLAISEKMRSQIGGVKKSMSNVQDGISLIQTAEGGLQEVHGILQRVRELAIQSSNDTLTNSDRGLIQKEVNQLLTEIDRFSSTVEFNTKVLLSGQFATGNGSLVFHVGANKSQVISVNVGTMSTTGLGINSLQTNGMTTRLAAESSIALLDTAINSVSGTRADLGAVQNRLERTFSMLGVYRENIQASESQIRDTDVASEVVDFTKNQILTQAGTAMLAQANARTATLLQLLQ